MSLVGDTSILVRAPELRRFAAAHPTSRWRFGRHRR